MRDINALKLGEIKLEDIIEYCKENKQTDWLKEVALATDKVDKNGKPRKVSFIEIRNEFCRKFFDEKAPQKSEKKPSMYDIIANL